MKRLKLFPKIFLYTMSIMLFVVVVTHGLIYLSAPRMHIEVTTSDTVPETISANIDYVNIIAGAVRSVLPITLTCSFLVSMVCALLFTKTITDPIKRVSDSTEQMMKLQRGVNCSVNTEDEIGVLAQNIIDLYSNLLSTIEHLEQEKDRVSEMERARVDFMRAASHELKTPVTALNATLENMILGVGKYQDYDARLPECKEIVEQLSAMIHDILETSKLNVISEPAKAVDVSELLAKLCEPYQMIAAAHHISFSLDLSKTFSAVLPVGSFSKAVSNILANAVAYTQAGKAVSVYLDGRSLIIENECAPIPDNEISRLFEPFYRPDYSRSRDNGGNGLGLHIVKTLLTSMNISYSFLPMKSPPGMCFTIRL